MKVKNSIIFVLLLLLAVAGGYYFGFKADLFKSHETTNVSSIVERINKVMKMVSVEGHIAEIYDYKSYNTYDISMLRKKILIRVNAKVLIGYDLEKAEIDVDEFSKTITINNFPPEEILSVDHELDYYDIQEGTFNKFSEDELNRLNKEAKEYASQKALTEELYEEARAQKDQSLELLREILEATGWKLKVVDAEPLIKG